ncbi:hypothetical protein K6119_17235 [Paracrocinitomix mangrovi]|uniref:hypothetical protein n=1 Tax=Paracrocinitomix mangrovi TaxID=2862509 RepID=UPI001C8E4C4A|nr:hypothetical protein [Paracrocinitomix mangrovi]UKN01471.1 hypothetical protein K6119_17235 [Paracrocinitomix mangrovi]
MKKALLYSILLSWFVSSCYFVDDIFDPPPPKELTLQEKAEKSVSSFLKKKLGEKYNPYGFGKITIHKPVEIVELEKLERDNKISPSPKLDTLIKNQKQLIRDNNIERTLDLDHFFTNKDSSDKYTVYETNFILNDTLGVKNLNGKIMLNLDQNMEEIVTFYFYEYNIFETGSYYESRELSRNFYSFFKSELERRNGMLEKSAFLKHTLNLAKMIQHTGSFDQQKILEKNVINYVKEERKDIADYKQLKFSDLYQTEDGNDNNISGYYFFHKFIGNYNSTLDTNVVLVEFSPYYEIENIYQMDRPFEQYFK